MLRAQLIEALPIPIQIPLRTACNTAERSGTSKHLARSLRLSLFRWLEQNPVAIWWCPLEGFAENVGNVRGNLVNGTHKIHTGAGL
jgi:hypothetical protein